MGMQGRKKCCPSCLLWKKENTEQNDLNQSWMSCQYSLGLEKIDHHNYFGRPVFLQISQLALQLHVLNCGSPCEL